jgi:hypothetical protein
MDAKMRVGIAQYGMRLLAGRPVDDVSGRVVLNPGDDLVARDLVRGRRLLVRLTGEDFGFDLEKWHGFLAATPLYDPDGQLKDPEVCATFITPNIALQKRPKFAEYVILAEAAWRAGVEADVTYESLIEQKREAFRRSGFGLKRAY